MLLAADAKTPAKAVKEGHGVAGTTFTYAVGKLVLWSSDAALVKDQKALLHPTVKKSPSQTLVLLRTARPPFRRSTLSR